MKQAKSSHGRGAHSVAATTASRPYLSNCSWGRRGLGCTPSRNRLASGDPPKRSSREQPVKRPPADNARWAQAATAPEPPPNDRSVSVAADAQAPTQGGSTARRHAPRAPVRCLALRSSFVLACGDDPSPRSRPAHGVSPCRPTTTPSPGSAAIPAPAALRPWPS